MYLYIYIYIYIIYMWAVETQNDRTLSTHMDRSLCSGVFALQAPCQNQDRAWCVTGDSQGHGTKCQPLPPKAHDSLNCGIQPLNPKPETAPQVVYGSLK